MAKMSSLLKNAAKICGEFENIEPEAIITAAKPLEKDLIETSGISIEIDIKIPFLNDSSDIQDAEITLKQAELTDEGSLHLTCLAQALSEDTTSVSDSPPSRVVAATPEENSTEKQSGEETAKNESDDIGQVQDGGGDSDEQSIKEVQLEPNEENQKQVTKSLQSVERETPAYQDPEKLREVYEAHETFTEMTDALGVEVTPQTVRRYMIKHGIHQPSPSTQSSSISALLEADPDSVPPKGEDKKNDKTEDDVSIAPTQGKENDLNNESAETTKKENTPPVSRDGGTNIITGNETVFDKEDCETPVSEIIDEDINLPEDFTLAEMKDTIRKSNTIYDVERELNIDRKEARDLLQNLNLFDLIHGRLSTRDFKKKTVDEINNRIQLAKQKSS